MKLNSWRWAQVIFAFDLFFVQVEPRFQVTDAAALLIVAQPLPCP